MKFNFSYFTLQLIDELWKLNVEAGLMDTIQLCREY